jgi:hypothetical protein
MRRGTNWIELLTCERCGRSELVHLSQLDGNARGMRVDTVPEGFGFADHELGEPFTCEVCENRYRDSSP